MYIGCIYGVFRGVLGICMGHIYMYNGCTYIGVHVVMKVYNGCTKGIIMMGSH